MKTITTNLFLSGIAIFFVFIGHAQPNSPEGFGLKETVITSKELGDVHYYVTMNKQDSVKPLLVYIDGSGAYPLFQTYDDGGIGSSVVLDFTQLSEEYHVVLISKPGVPFIDKLGFDEERGWPIYEPPSEYNERLSLDWRVNSADEVIKDCISKFKVDESKVAIIGISEGYQVGASLLKKNKSITHSILMVGSGLNQLYNFIILNRLDAETGKISRQEAQENIDSLHVMYEDIYKYPTATDKMWYGHTYLRWASFCSVDPLDGIMSTDIPIYLVSCSDDRNSSVINADYVKLEATRQNKQNITSIVYPYDHSFRETIRDDYGQIIDKVDHMGESIDASLIWLKAQ